MKKIINQLFKRKRFGITFLIMILWLSRTCVMNGQSVDRNYIIQTDLLVQVPYNTDVRTLPDGQKMDVIQYFDGLGRPLQTNSYHSSPSLKDLIQHIEYDSLGRQTKEFMPYPAQVDGSFQDDADTNTLSYYSSRSDNTIPYTAYPYGEKAFDNSPLNRVMKQGFPGESWQLNAHPQTFHYLTYTNATHVPVFVLNEQTMQFSINTNYNSNTLSISRVVDEDGNITDNYKDKDHKVVLLEKDLSGTKLRTYYIYDKFGNLAVVVQPEGSKTISGSFTSTSQFIEKWCFTYVYDSLNRLVEKRIPGMKKPIYMIYDNLDRVILTQDGNMRTGSKWLFTKYDILGRPVLSGFYYNSSDTGRIAMQSLADRYISHGSNFEYRTSEPCDPKDDFHGYTNFNAFPPGVDCKTLNVYYYDDYDFDSDSTSDFSYYHYSPFGNLDLIEQPKGLPTGTKTKMLDGCPIQNPWMVSVSFYDKKSRIIQQQVQNHFGNFDTTTTQYNFIGDVLQTHTSHARINVHLIVNDSMVYDHARRLRYTYMKVNNQPKFLMADYHYNELGQLIEKNLHKSNSTDILQSLDYSYNIRGWLKGINLRGNGNDANDVFSQELVYDSAMSALSCVARYNGNISANLWKHSSSITARGYGYTYDAMNRLTKAVYGVKSGSTWSSSSNYYIPYIIYDYNGNITEMQRYGLCGQQYSLMDLLVYYYEGNRVIGVNDPVNNYYGFQDNGHFYPSGGPEYLYDANGNLIHEFNKGIKNIYYNHLNLPYEFEFENIRSIYYLYDANGTKLQKTYYENNRLLETTDYSGMFVYKDGHVDYIRTPEGRLKWDDHDGVFYAEYYIKDHLGNVRSVVTSAPVQAYALQGTDYYPFGLEIPVYGTCDNQTKYNSKELQTEADLDWYDYGARFYDPVLARWHSVDPMAEKSRRWSPYVYTFDNPLKYTDPDGMWGKKVHEIIKGLCK
jgi:RHS repeat-associated protein